MSKIVEIKSCSECPRAPYVETQDPRVKRVYVGCEVSHRSFDFDYMNMDPMPIQPWCELPDAEGNLPARKKDPHQEDFR
jgi:hypothetical protein